MGRKGKTVGLELNRKIGDLGSLDYRMLCRFQIVFIRSMSNLDYV